MWETPVTVCGGSQFVFVVRQERAGDKLHTLGPRKFEDGCNDPICDEMIPRRTLVGISPVVWWFPHNPSLYERLI